MDVVEDIYDQEPTPDKSKPFANPNRNLIFIPVTASIPGGTICAKSHVQLDGGAACNLITLEMATALLGGHKINQTGQQYRIEGVGGNILPTLGTVTIGLDLMGRDTSITAG